MSPQKKHNIFTLGVCPLTFPARAREPWTLPEKGREEKEALTGMFSRQTKDPAIVRSIYLLSSKI